MVTVVCIGSAPSSGSTLLADLLDAVPGMAATPELNIFCNQASYEFSDGMRDSVLSNTAMPTRSRYVAACKFFNRKHLDVVGLSTGDLAKSVQESSTLADFVEIFSRLYGRHRQRPVDVLVEKTPSNINYAPDFCRMFPDSLFVSIVRDGRAVVASLKRRGYTPFEASLIWQMQVSYGLRAKGMSNYCEIRYEDLVRDPFDVTTKLASKVGISVTPERIKERFADNDYRAELPRVSSWTAPDYTGSIQPVPPYADQLDADEISWCQSSLLFGRSRGKVGQIASFSKLLKRYGYPLDPSAKLGRKYSQKMHASYLVSSKNVLRQSDLRVIYGRDQSWPIADQLMYSGLSLEAELGPPLSDEWPWTRELP